MFDWNPTTFTLTIPFSGQTTIPIIDQYEAEAIIIDVKSGFTTVPNYCFSNFTNLTTLNLPDTIIQIDDEIFARTKVSAFRMPSSCSKICPWNPFDQALHLERFIVDKDHQYFREVDGILYSKDFKVFCALPIAKQITELKIHQKTEKILYGSITRNNYITKIIIPTTVKVIEPTFCFYTRKLNELIIYYCHEKHSFENKNDFFGINFKKKDIEWISYCITKMNVNYALLFRRSATSRIIFNPIFLFVLTLSS